MSDICGVFFVILIVGVLASMVQCSDAREQRMQEALKNSNIVCEPVKIDGKYYCGTKRVFITNGVEHTVSVDKQN